MYLQTKQLANTKLLKSHPDRIKQAGGFHKLNFQELQMKMSSSTYPSKRYGRNKYTEMSMLLTVKMEDSNWIPVALYEKIKTQIKRNIPHLHSDIYLVPEDLVGNEFWCALSEAEKHMAKICIAHISVTKALSIRAREFDLEYAHVYDLRYKDLIASNDDFSDYHY